MRVGLSHELFLDRIHVHEFVKDVHVFTEKLELSSSGANLQGWERRAGSHEQHGGGLEGFNNKEYDLVGEQRAQRKVWGRVKGEGGARTASASTTAFMLFRVSVSFFFWGSTSVFLDFVSSSSPDSSETSTAGPRSSSSNSFDIILSKKKE